MCIPHGASVGKDSGYVEEKPKKHVEPVSKEQFEKGDPDFADKRTKPQTPKKSKSWLVWLLD